MADSNAPAATIDASTLRRSMRIRQGTTDTTSTEAGTSVVSQPPNVSVTHIAITEHIIETPATMEEMCSQHPYGMSHYPCPLGSAQGPGDPVRVSRENEIARVEVEITSIRQREREMYGGLPPASSYLHMPWASAYNTYTPCGASAVSPGQYQWPEFNFKGEDDILSPNRL
ncbi:uncharacterized protein G2W53_037202 [Senna tora]|uniref:Uncharacterized protein n=1 Tax=Senna tora TaxID=362788 RepID=A0A834SUZ2_9FABA|nr:uncharacterized protein G2W53_037202 [Senna tora]